MFQFRYCLHYAENQISGSQRTLKIIYEPKKSYYVYWNISSNRESTGSQIITNIQIYTVVLYQKRHEMWIDFGLITAPAPPIYMIFIEISIKNIQNFSNQNNYLVNIYHVQGSVLGSLYEWGISFNSYNNLVKYNHQAHFKDK